jgi:hypothetical protein
MDEVLLRGRAIGSLRLFLLHQLYLLHQLISLLHPVSPLHAQQSLHSYRLSHQPRQEVTVTVIQYRHLLNRIVLSPSISLSVIAAPTPVPGEIHIFRLSIAHRAVLERQLSHCHL